MLDVFLVGTLISMTSCDLVRVRMAAAVGV